MNVLKFHIQVFRIRPEAWSKADELRKGACDGDETDKDLEEKHGDSFNC